MYVQSLFQKCVCKSEVTSQSHKNVLFLVAFLVSVCLNFQTVSLLELDLQPRIVQCAYGGFFTGTTVYYDNDVICGIQLHCSREYLLIEGMGRVPDNYLFGRNWRINSQSKQEPSESIAAWCKINDFPEQPIILEEKGLYSVYGFLNQYNSTIWHQYQDAINGLQDVRMKADGSGIESLTFVCYPYSPYRDELHIEQEYAYVLNQNQSNFENVSKVCSHDEMYDDGEGRQQPYKVYSVMSAIDITFIHNSTLINVAATTPQRCRNVLPRDPTEMEGCGPNQDSTIGDTIFYATTQDPYGVDEPVFEAGCLVARNRGWFDAQCQGYPNEYCKYITDYHGEPHHTCSMSNYWKCSEFTEYCRNLHSDAETFLEGELVNYTMNCKDDDYITHGWFMLKTPDNEQQCLEAFQDNRTEFAQCRESQNFAQYFREAKAGLYESGVFPGYCVRQDYSSLTNCEIISNEQVTLLASEIKPNNWTMDVQVLSEIFDGITSGLEQFTGGDAGTHTLQNDYFWNPSAVQQIIWHQKQLRNDHVRSVDLMLQEPPWRRWREIWSNQHGRIVHLRMTIWNQNKLEGSLSSAIFKLQRLRAFNTRLTQFSGPLPSTSDVNISGALRALDLGDSQYSGSLPIQWPQDLFSVRLLKIEKNNVSGPVPAAWMAENAFYSEGFHPPKVNVAGTRLCYNILPNIPNEHFTKKSGIPKCQDMVQEQDYVEIKIVLLGEGTCVNCETAKRTAMFLISDTSSHLINIQTNETKCYQDCATQNKSSPYQTTVILAGKGQKKDKAQIQSLVQDRIQQSPYPTFNIIIQEINYTTMNASSSEEIVQQQGQNIVPPPVVQKDDSSDVGFIIPLVILCALVLACIITLVILAWKLRRTHATLTTITASSPMYKSLPETEGSGSLLITVGYGREALRSRILDQIGTMEESCVLSVVSEEQSNEDVIGKMPTNIKVFQKMDKHRGRITGLTFLDINVDIAKDLVLLSQLGQGGFGVVYKALWNTRAGTEKVVAVKMLNTESLSDVVSEEERQKVFNAFYEEINTMLRLQHPGIVTFYGASVKPPVLALLMEYMDGGSLDQYLHEEQRQISYNEILSVLHSIVQVLCYLHPHILHRDIKPSNILLDRHGAIKLADFGLSQIKSVDKSLSFSNAIGTPAYLAPEVWKDQKCTTKSDIYQLGLVAWEMVSGEHPWSDCNNVGQIIQKVLVQQERPPMPTNCPLFLENLIKDCWAQNPKLRPSADQIRKLLEKELTKHIRQTI